MEKYGKTAVFLGGYGRIGEIPQGRLRPDWGLKGPLITFDLLKIEGFWRQTETYKTLIGYQKYAGGVLDGP